MKRIHIVGRKNSGKTTLITELVSHLTSEGMRVGTVKHTHHDHELDTPGKDSYLHRMAGASVVGILSPRLNAVYYRGDSEHNSPDPYESLAPMFSECDLILVEGHSQVPAPQVEVWRALVAMPPMARDDPSILAVVTDEPLEIDTPILARNDLAVLSGRLLAWCSP